jgi:hypothetical protein
LPVLSPLLESGERGSILDTERGEFLGPTGYGPVVEVEVLVDVPRPGVQTLQERRRDPKRAERPQPGAPIIVLVVGGEALVGSKQRVDDIRKLEHTPTGKFVCVRTGLWAEGGGRVANMAL